MQQKKVLIAPLDWGLGHATRCIPVITALLELGYHVTIATDGAHEIILREAFPNLTFLRLKEWIGRGATPRFYIFYNFFKSMTIAV